jgi:hypothetical protein
MDKPSSLVPLAIEYKDSAESKSIGLSRPLSIFWNFGVPLGFGQKGEGVIQSNATNHKACQITPSVV